MQVCFQATTISSAMFITAMAANPLAVNLAAEAIGITISWGQWALAGIVPGLFALLTMPLLMYIIYPPEKKDTPDAPALAKKELEKLGPMSTDEKITAGAFAVTVALWIFGSSIGINAVAAALVGLTVLLVHQCVSLVMRGTAAICTCTSAAEPTESANLLCHWCACLGGIEHLLE